MTRRQRGRFLRPLVRRRVESGETTNTAQAAPAKTPKPQTAKVEQDNDDDDDNPPTNGTGNPSFNGAGQAPIRTALPEKSGTLRK